MHNEKSTLEMRVLWVEKQQEKIVTEIESLVEEVGELKACNIRFSERLDNLILKVGELTDWAKKIFSVLVATSFGLLIWLLKMIVERSLM